MVISKGGQVQDASVIIINTDNKEINPTKVTAPASAKVGGARRLAATRTSIEFPKAAVVCVSQNGTIDIFINGRSWPVPEAISGISK